MMKFTVRSVRGIKEADIDIEGITLIGGQNQAGKSTLLSTAAALMIGDRNLYGATQKDASSVISTGATVASARLMAEAVGGDMPDWSVGLIWPKCERTESPPLPPANDVTVGRVDPVAQLDAKGWASFIRSVSGAGKVSTTDVQRELDQLQPDPKHMDLVANALKSGWDAATAFCDGKRLEARKVWEKATGEKFGTSKASGWRHPDFFDGNAPIEELEAELKRLDGERAQALALKEIGGKNTDELRGLIQAQGKDSNDLGSKIAAIQTELKKVQSELSFYPGSDPLHCPGCGVLLELKAGTLTEHKSTGYERHSDGHKDLLERKADLEKREREYSEARGKVVAAQQANISVLNALESSSKGGRTADVIENEVEGLKRAIDAQRATEGASRAFLDFTFWKSAMDILGPTGLRMRATVKALKELNPRISRLAEMLFPGQELILHHDPDENAVVLLCDRRPYESLVWNSDPNSYALRCKILFQLLEAQRLGEGAFVIIDRLDVLQKKHKNGVFKALISTGIPALVAQTMNEKPANDPLAKGGYGKTYWINDGVVEAV